jgi:cobalamin biosynthesis protein CobD/CbiB
LPRHYHLKTIKENKMAQEENAKGAFIEKLLFALLPLIIAGVGYLLSAVGTLAHQVTILESKMSLVVTSDNKQASNTGAELARERLRQDLTEAVQRNRDSIQQNREMIAIHEEKIKQLQRAQGVK